jgi:Fe-S-cluster-containing dehydrogenase component
VHGFGRALEELSDVVRGPLGDRIIHKLRDVARFCVYGKHHVLSQEGNPIDRIFVIKSGWVRRVRGVPLDASSTGIALGVGESIGADFLGAGNCLGLEGANGNEKWKYTASLMARTEVLEVPVSALAGDPELRDRLVAAFSGFSSADDRPPAIELVQDVGALASAEEEIATGIVDGENLLVMDMDLCVRCGNCSLACHHIHGQSRLLRRGIALTRPIKLGSRHTQHLLSPQVCMHCKDPECLTGCPTGSIFRDRQGQVDIDANTCIGCFDCATQCPYDAISMVPRNGNRKPEFDLFGTIKQKFNLAPALVRAPEPADDVVAIKCNLCENTSLNPRGVKRQAYSCEENCPTGALLRVDPLKYFTEIESTRGVIFQDKTHALTRNIHQSDPLSTAWRTGGIALTMAVALFTIWGLIRYGFDTPIAGTWLTMRWLTGFVGLAGTAAVMTYPLRKQIYRRRVGALRYWMLAHVYLGAVAAVVLLLHAGSKTGGLLTTALYVTFCFVIVTGLWGIVSYIFAPRIMTSIEGEPLLVEDLVGRREELIQELSTLITQSDGWLREEIEERVRRRFGSFGFLWQQWFRREQLTTLLARSREEFKDRIMRLATAEERTILLDAVETAVTLRRIDALIYLHKMLQLWIAPHVLATSLMLGLMVVHIIQVVYFAVK